MRWPLTYCMACECSTASKLPAGLWMRWPRGRPALRPPSGKGSLVECSPPLCLTFSAPGSSLSALCPRVCTFQSPLPPPRVGCFTALVVEGLLCFCFCLETLPWFSLPTAARARPGPQSLLALPASPAHSGRPALSFCLVLAEEKSSGFRLKPPTLIHGQAPSAGRCPLLGERGAGGLPRTLPGLCTPHWCSPGSVT